MFKKSNLFLLLGLVFLAASCNDFIEMNISEQTPVVILPAVNDTVPSNPVYFKWEKMEGATKYRLEVVSPSFASVQSYYVDSVVYGTDFQIDLDSNVYEMRLTAMNAGYESITTAPRQFWLGSSQGSSSGTVLLDEPAQGMYVNETFDGVFSWFVVPGTDSYTFELHKTATFAGFTEDYVDQIGATHVTSLDGSDLPEGTYSWGVKAFLSNGVETAYSKRVFYVDTVNPTVANLTSPATNTYSNAGLIPFTWSVPIDNGEVNSPVYSVLEISLNSTFTDLLPPEIVYGNSRSVELTSGTYYWRVRLKDDAGNTGPLPVTYRVLNILP
jgi:hypothetical protein